MSSACYNIIKEINQDAAAAALYDGGWRDGDQEDLMEEYGIDREHADDLCEVFKEYDRRSEEEGK